MLGGKRGKYNFFFLTIQIVKVLEELSADDFFQSVIIDKTKFETVVFNYFAAVSQPFSPPLTRIENVSRGPERGLEDREEEHQMGQKEGIRTLAMKRPLFSNFRLINLIKRVLFKFFLVII